MTGFRIKRKVVNYVPMFQFRGSQNEVYGPLWILKTLVRQSIGKNYFHNNKKTLFALFPLLTFALII